MNIFLKLKHWHLFLLLIGIPFFVSLIFAISPFLDAKARSALDLAANLIMIIPFVSYFLWIWSSGSWLSQKDNDRPVTGPYRFTLSVATSFIMFSLLLVYNFIYWENEETPASWAYLAVGLVMFVALFTWLYALTYLAKTLVRTERKSAVRSADYFSEFIMAVFLPIGIWFLQPRINRVYEGR
ncbi:hypothetical protein [Negadavirga shengliensis]|uniref:DUF4234 domain-containing protein n=1 Tax=Negadavirga shengliensis TaxID=1389218 RepID=A0ABV9SWQ0_9BACT